jgi:hypothetical protein
LIWGEHVCWRGFGEAQEPRFNDDKARYVSIYFGYTIIDVC